MPSMVSVIRLNGPMADRLAKKLQPFYYFSEENNETWRDYLKAGYVKGVVRQHGKRHADPTPPKNSADEQVWFDYAYELVR